jgi:hypothetical protein
MNSDKIEEKIRGLFQEVKRHDLQHAPAFNDILNRKMSQGSGTKGIALPWIHIAAAAAVIFLGVALFVFYCRQPESGLQSEPVAGIQKETEPEVPDQWTAFSNWQASTDSLLTVSSTPWSSRISTPTDSWMDDMSYPSEKVEVNGEEKL